MLDDWLIDILPLPDGLDEELAEAHGGWSTRGGVAGAVAVVSEHGLVGPLLAARTTHGEVRLLVHDILVRLEHQRFEEEPREWTIDLESMAGYEGHSQGVWVD